MYLNFTEYKSMGGAIDESSYMRLEAKARMQIDRATYGRLTDAAANIPESVRYCMFELIEAMVAEEAVGGVSTGRELSSMSNDGISVSFVTGSNSSSNNRFYGIIRGWLANEVSSCGVPLLYAGVCVT